MKVKLLTSRTGGQNAGDIIEVPADEGKRMIDAGQAEIARNKKRETAAKTPDAEKAAK